MRPIKNFQCNRLKLSITVSPIKPFPPRHSSQQTSCLQYSTSTLHYRTRPTSSTVTANHVNTKKIRYIDDLSSASYYFENGLRKVKPYYFDYHASAKDRWVDQPLLTVMNTEFRDRDDKYFRMAIERGYIKINGRQVTSDTLFRKGDTMSHSVHRHEPPAAASDPIELIHQDDDLLVIHKPAGLQAHPSGRYRHNTAVHILRKQLNLPSLYPINRLDRLTSGLMMIGLNARKAQAIQHEMMAGSIEKEYLCRVEGEFPSGPIVCDAPLKTIAFKFSFQYVDFGSGKPSKTIFERVSYNGRTSLVKCYPVTGRTHQLRVHLRYLGYPIANDPVYGRYTPWSHLLDVVDLHRPSASPSRFADVIDSMLKKTTFDTLDVTDGKPRCGECHGLLVSDPLPGQELGIWLHAQRYAGKHWSYTTNEKNLLPWTHNDFDGDRTIIPAYV